MQVNNPGSTSVPDPIVPADGVQNVTGGLRTSTSLVADTTVQAVAGTGTQTYLSEGVVNTNTTNVGNGADVTEDDLMTYTVPANSLSANGKIIRFYGWGITAANADGKTLRVRWGGTQIGSIILTPNLNNIWIVEGIIIRDGAISQKCILNMMDSGTQLNLMARTGTLINEALDQILKFTAQSTVANANNIVQHGMFVEFLA